MTKKCLFGSCCNLSALTTCSCVREIIECICKCIKYEEAQGYILLVTVRLCIYYTCEIVLWGLLSPLVWWHVVRQDFTNVLCVTSFSNVIIFVIGTAEFPEASLYV
jgi:hypothetical protein